MKLNLPTPISRLGLAWGAVNALGWAASLMLLYFALGRTEMNLPWLDSALILVGVVGSAMAIGIAQKSMLRHWLQPVGPWVFVTTFGTVAGSCLGLILGGMAFYLPPLGSRSFDSNILIASAIFGLVLGWVTGWLQCFCLGRAYSWRWVGVWANLNALAYFVGCLLVADVLVAFQFSLLMIPGNFISGALQAAFAGLIGGAAAGLITTAFLADLLRDIWDASLT